jgi:intracellular septation protein
MKILLDFLPWALFFATYKLRDIYAATAVLMAATVVQMAIVYWLDKKLTLVHKVTLALVLIAGALTLVLHDARFIKWKPTVLYAAMAVALAAAQWGWHKNFLKLMLGSQLTLPDQVWHRLGAAWVVYALFMSALNGYVAACYSTNAWAAFKLWGFAFPVVFIIGQGVYVARYLQIPSGESDRPPEDAP